MIDMPEEGDVGMILDDFVTGQIFRSPAMALAPELIAAFPDEFGPSQDAVSTMAVASMTMRLMVESGFQPEGGIMGAGVEEMEWPNRARSGDLLRTESEVIEIRRSRRRPDIGLLRLRNTTLNGDGQVVQSMISTIVVPTAR